MENYKSDLEQAIQNFAIRVLRGECSPQETAILPEILSMIDPVKRAASGN